MERHKTQYRTLPSKFTTREEDNAPVIEGYFAVFDSIYDMGYGMTESIAPVHFPTRFPVMSEHWQTMTPVWYWDGQPHTRWNCGRTAMDCGEKSSLIPKIRMR